MRLPERPAMLFQAERVGPTRGDRAGCPDSSAVLRQLPLDLVCTQCPHGRVAGLQVPHGT